MKVQSPFVVHTSYGWALMALRLVKVHIFTAAAPSGMVTLAPIYDFVQDLKQGGK